MKRYNSKWLNKLLEISKTQAASVKSENICTITDLFYAKLLYISVVSVNCISVNDLFDNFLKRKTK